MPPLGIKNTTWHNQLLCSTHDLCDCPNLSWVWAAGSWRIMNIHERINHAVRLFVLNSFRRIYDILLGLWGMGLCSYYIDHNLSYLTDTIQFFVDFICSGQAWCITNWSIYHSNVRFGRTIACGKGKEQSTCIIYVHSFILLLLIGYVFNIMNILWGYSFIHALYVLYGLWIWSLQDYLSTDNACIMHIALNADAFNCKYIICNKYSENAKSSKPSSVCI